MRNGLPMILAVAIFVVGFATFLLSPWHALFQDNTGEDFAILHDLALDSSAESPLGCTTGDNPCYVLAQPFAAGWWLHIFHYDNQQREGIVYQMARNGAGGFIVQEGPEALIKAHAGPFHTIDAKMENMKTIAFLQGCTMADPMGFNTHIQNGSSECQLTFVGDNSFKLTPVPLRAPLN